MLKHLLRNRLICVIVGLIVTLAPLARADSIFSPTLVFDHAGNAQVLSLAGVNQIGWTFAPHEALASPVLIFAFPIPQENVIMSATLFLSSLNFSITTWPVNSIGACTEPCDLWVLAGIELPRFYGTKTGWISFTFGDHRSGQFQIALTEPVPEPSTLMLLGTGLVVLALAALRRLRSEVLQPHHASRWSF